MLKLTASGGDPIWVRPGAIIAFRAPLPLELKGEPNAAFTKAVVYVSDLGWHVRNTPEEIAKALEKC